MRYLSTSGGPYTMVDDEDYVRWSEYAWSTTDDGYPAAYFQIRPGKVYLIRLHRLIACPGPGEFVHHKNRRVFDNRRENLMCVTASQHAAEHPENEQLQAMAERGITSWHLRNLWRIEAMIRDRDRARRR